MQRARIGPARARTGRPLARVLPRIVVALIVVTLLAIVGAPGGSAGEPTPLPSGVPGPSPQRSPTPPPRPDPLPPGFVTRSGTQLMLDGQPYRFAGINMYNANSDGWCGHEMRSPGRLAAAFNALAPGTNAIRAWFNQPLSENWDLGIRDWSAFDNTLAQAAIHGLKVIVTLGGHWGECGTKAPQGTDLV
jgi:hypothetical protein